MGNQWVLMIFSALLSVSGGMAVAVAAGEAKKMTLRPLICFALAAGVLAIAGTGAVFFSIGRPQLIFSVLSNPGSGMFWKLILAVCLIAALALYVYSSYAMHEECIIRGWACAAALAAMMLSFAIGQSQVMAWKPHWNTELIALAFVLWTWVCFSLSLLLLEYWCAEKTLDCGLVLISLTAMAVTLAAYVIFTLPLEEESSRLLTGDLAGIFWTTLITGVGIPGVLVSLPKCRLTLAAALISAGVAVALFEQMIFQLGMPSWHFF